MSSYYATLGVQENATPQEVRKAYQHIRLKNNPDKIGSLPELQRPLGKNVAKTENVACEVLGDEHSRAAYDHKINAPSYSKQTSQKRKASTHPPSNIPNPNNSKRKRPGFSRDSEYSTFNRAGPEVFHNTLTIHRPSSWRMSITFSPRFRAHQLSKRNVFIEEGRIIFLARIEHLGSACSSGQRDVRLIVGEGPDRRKITKVETMPIHTDDFKKNHYFLGVQLFAPKSAPRNWLH
ncbi:hypothetical protein BS50DRAFT_632525 [Corynespora cassiicola Philippines]|uniref:J domain-containing protein n=1 Tax=Corynespora cassiicola Philippines TaxID=1448308 RepID=A0A2T2NT41_CORCC|nr:hypothetical protein BS50DRAFT_632525 [Corynespora cassiicola Philippines]